MGNNSRKNHTADFKAKVALEALKEQMTLPELEKKFGVSQYTISRWQKVNVSDCHYRCIFPCHYGITPPTILTAPPLPHIGFIQ